ncbi:MAG: YeeE/YedE family protein [Candidatus Cloacimonetes bacterium]|nr:YeeE/YedE family protein [Candidatus Cloacimonadota bacterium]MBS3767315.1 YeeE/YedE family protein [Candidatus Cloacimonadota bacterium]
MSWLTEVSWSPYAVGIGIGILSWFTFLISKKPIGCSTAFARTSGMIEKIFRGKKVEKKLYYQEFRPVVDWEWMLVLGVVLGSLVSSVISGDFNLQWLPSLWVGTFGSSVIIRIIVALVGGIFLGFGARWAGGCTSGHGISGTLQLVISSWVSAICFFIGGIIAAMIIYNVIG